MLEVPEKTNERRRRMTEYIVTLANNGYIVEGEEPAMRLVYEGGNELPLRMMRELLADLDHAIEQGEGSKFKVRIDVEY